MVKIPNNFHDLFENRTIAHFTTLQADGRPHSTPIWIDYDFEENRMLINTEIGRQKHVNVRRDPRVAISMTDPDDPYRWLSITGTVTDTVESGAAAAHIDRLARRYRNNERYSGTRSNRVILKIRPEELFD